VLFGHAIRTRQKLDFGTGVKTAELNSTPIPWSE
jgi:hypothetical protein